MPTILSDVTVSEVSVVDEPANAEARVLLWKKADGWKPCEDCPDPKVCAGKCKSESDQPKRSGGVRKSGQPRAPAGTPTGGQWVSGGAAADGNRAARARGVTSGRAKFARDFAPGGKVRPKGLGAEKVGMRLSPEAMKLLDTHDVTGMQIESRRWVEQGSAKMRQAKDVMQAAAAQRRAGRKAFEAPDGSPMARFNGAPVREVLRQAAVDYAAGRQKVRDGKAMRSTLMEMDAAVRKDGRRGRDGDGDGILNESKKPKRSKTGRARMTPGAKRRFDDLAARAGKFGPMFPAERRFALFAAKMPKGTTLAQARAKWDEQKGYRAKRPVRKHALAFLPAGTKARILKAAQTFGDIHGQREARDKMFRMIVTLQDSLFSIANDTEISDEQRIALARQSVGEFEGALEGEFGDLADEDDDGEDVEKAAASGDEAGGSGRDEDGEGHMDDDLEKLIKSLAAGEDDNGDETEGDEPESRQDETVQKALAENVALKKRLDEIEDRERTRVLTEKAKEMLGNVAADPAAVAGILKALTPEQTEVFEGVLKSANAIAQSSAMFQSFGKAAEAGQQESGLVTLAKRRAEAAKERRGAA